MTVDFSDAAERHWEDAEYLFVDKRLPNSDHLFGLSAECALKAVMEALGMTMRPSGVPEKTYKVHINELWNHFLSFASGRVGANYAASLRTTLNPFTDWDVSDRYNNRLEFLPTVVADHRQGAVQTRKVLHQAIADGVI
jgi:hypothetical protein